MRRFVVVAFALLVIGATATACRPGTTPGTPESIDTYADTEQAIDATFAPFGPFVVWCAHEVVDNESGHWPYAGWGRTYQGPWQMHAGFMGTITNLAAAYGFLIASRHDPYLSTLAARDAFVAAGGSFRANWAGTVPGDCP